MPNFLPRSSEEKLLQLVERYPVVVLVGPRQVGKTSLVKHLMAKLDKESVYLDLELPTDANKLSYPELFLEPLAKQTVIIDEVQRLPLLFPILRSIVDRERVPGRFILLGSASPELIRDTSESLAGRVAYFELAPFSFSEVKGQYKLEQHWVRGGFPESFLAESEDGSFDWRLNFIQTYLERDLPLLGLRADPLLIRRLWTMVAHISGELLNMEKLASSLGVSGPTIRRYLDFMESAFLIRRLPPYHFNIKKRLVKSPKVYVRDTGILHALLNIGSHQQLLGHPNLGQSWETYILQEIASLRPPRTELFFYRTQDGTEADIVIAPGGVPESLVEVKFTTTPKPGRSFQIAKSDLGTTKNFIACPIEKGYTINDDIKILGYKELGQVFTPAIFT